MRYKFLNEYMHFAGKRIAIIESGCKSIVWTWLSSESAIFQFELVMNDLNFGYHDSAVADA